MLFVGFFVVRVIRPNHFEVFAVSDFDTGLHNRASARWNSYNLNFVDSLEGWALDFASKDPLEVLDVPLLTWLRYAASSDKSFPAIKSNCVFVIFSESRINQKAADRSARSSLAGVAVDGHHVMGLLH